MGVVGGKRKKKYIERESNTKGAGTVARDQASMASPSYHLRLDVISQDCAKETLAVPRS